MMCLAVRLTGLERIATTLFRVWKCVRDATVTAAGPKAMDENRRAAVFLRFSYQSYKKPGCSVTPNKKDVFGLIMSKIMRI